MFCVNMEQACETELPLVATLSEIGSTGDGVLFMPNPINSLGFA